MATDRDIQTKVKIIIYVTYVRMKLYNSDIIAFTCSFTNLVLRTVFPLLVADLIPLDDENWANYLQLMKIMEYIFSPSTLKLL